MVSDFFLSQFKLNIFCLSPEQQQNLVIQGAVFKAIVNFEYEKTNDKYQIEEKFLDQVIKMALSIKKALYPVYKLLFMFNNVISYLIHIKIFSKLEI